MKKKATILIKAVIVLFGLVCWAGIGPYSSGSAVSDLKEEMAKIHGEPYVGRAVENGTEDMEFVVKPATFFLTDYNLRTFFSWDYTYDCQVIYTTHVGGDEPQTRTIEYRGIDPMGHDEAEVRAYIEIGEEA